MLDDAFVARNLVKKGVKDPLLEVPCAYLTASAFFIQVAAVSI